VSHSDQWVVDPQAVEQAGLRQQEGPAAHRGDPAGARRRGPQPSYEALVGHGGGGPGAAGDQQRVDGLVAGGPFGAERQARRGRDRPSGRGHEHSGVGRIGAVAVGHREHLERADDVERLYVGEGDDDHGPGQAGRRVGVGL
jgi:hypothetical protein